MHEAQEPGRAAGPPRKRSATGRAVAGAVATFVAVAAAEIVPAFLRHRWALAPVLGLGILLAAGLAAAVYRLLRGPERLREQVRERTARLETVLADVRLQRERHQATSEHLRRVLQSSPEAVVAGDGDGTITDWNDAAERLTGWRRDEIVGGHVSLLVPEGEEPMTLDGPPEEDARGAIRSVVPRLRKDGSVFRAEVALSLFRRPGGRIRSWVAVVRDVSRDRLVADAQDAVRSNLQPAEAVAALTGPLSELCEGLELVSLLEVTGTTAKRLASVSRTGDVLAPPEHLALGESLLGRAVETRRVSLAIGSEPDRAVGPARLAWRVIVPIERSGTVVAAIGIGGGGGAPSGRVLGLLQGLGGAVAQDVVNVLLYERQREAMERLYELDQLKSDFLSAVSHELRTPLTAITGFAATLDERWADLHPAVRRDFVGRILDRSRGLDDLVQELLDYSLLERHHLRVEPVPCDLRREALREVADIAHALRNHRVRTDVPEGLLVEADPSALSRILQNLLTNAAKFSSPDTEIAVAAEKSTGHVVVRVSDEGIGIPVEEHERIFERFYRVGRGDRVRAGGTGIGLALVKEYVEALGGRVWVESELGAGSTFCFTLRRVGAVSASGEVLHEAARLPDGGRRPVAREEADAVAQLREAPD